MSRVELTLIAVGVRKWELESQKISLNSYFLVKDSERSIGFEISILQPPEMVEEFLGKTRFEASRQLVEEGADGDKPDVVFDNETFLRQKLYNYFKRITSELNNPKRKKGQPKMIFTTQMDVYNENQDISFLPKRIQFYVVLNWARKYYDRDDFKRSVEPLRKLIKVNPEYGPGYKFLARSLKKIRKYDEAMRYYEKYAEVDGTVEAQLDLAKSYRKGKVFDKSEAIYHEIIKKDPKNREARIGLAQIKYANKDMSYLDVLDELNKEDSKWLKAWLIDEFNFRIYVTEKTPLSPVQAAKFLGYNQIFELTQRAFKNEVPSHFNPSKARLSFFLEELDNWAKAMNKYQCLDTEIETYPDKIDSPDELGRDIDPVETVSTTEAVTTQDGQPLSKVEQILRQIRARKAERQIEQAAAAAAAESNAETAPKRTKKPRTSKKATNKAIVQEEPGSAKKAANGRRRRKI